MVVPHSTKGAIKLFETLGVLIVFMILLGFALIFYNVVQKGALQEDLAQQAERKSLEISEKSLLLPELDCSITGVTEINCIDVLKLTSFSKVANSSLRAQAEYFNVFESSVVTVRQLWPPANWSVTLYNRTPERYRSITSFSSPILLRHPLQDTNTFGIIEVQTYAEQ
jgi:hypothetical protein